MTRVLKVRPSWTVTIAVYGAGRCGQQWL